MITNLWATPFFRPDSLRPEEYQVSFISLLICTLAISILSLALPVMTLQVYDRILPNPGSGTLLILTMGVCLAIVLEAILRICRAYTIGWAGAAYEHKLSCKAMRYVLKSDPLQMANQGIGDHLHQISSISKLKDFYNGYSFTVFLELIFVPIYLALIYYIAPPLVFVPALILAIFTIVSMLAGIRLRRALKARDEADNMRFNFLIEALEGIHSVKAFGIEKFFERRYEALEQESCIKNFHVTQETASTFNTGMIFSNLVMITVISVGAYFVIHDQMTTGALIATLLLSGRMMQPVQKALSLWARYQDYILAREHLVHLFNVPKENDHANFQYPKMRDGRLEIQNLSFSLSSDQPRILENINLKVHSGEMILINGDHGAGKSILLNLIAGIYMPHSGRINIDGEDVQNYPPEILTQHVGYIRTDNLIFRGSIRDNMTCFGQTDEKSAREIAALLKVDRDIAKLPSGFDTFLSGNATDNISPGLKQRIAMTRALATKPRLILFDNADRALDSEGYELVYSLIARLKGKATFILITNDQNLSRLADRCFTLQNGTLTETKSLHNISNIEFFQRGS